MSVIIYIVRYRSCMRSRVCFNKWMGKAGSHNGNAPAMLMQQRGVTNIAGQGKDWPAYSLC